MALIEFARHRKRIGRTESSCCVARRGWPRACFVGAALVFGFFAAAGVLDRFLLDLRDGTRVRRVPHRGLRLVPDVLDPDSRPGFEPTWPWWRWGWPGSRACSFRTVERPGSVIRPTYPLAVWFFVALMEAGVTRINFTHYHLLAGSAAGLARGTGRGGGVPAIATGCSSRGRAGFACRSSRWSPHSCCSPAIGPNMNLMKHWARYQVGTEDHQTYLVRGWFLGQDLIRVQKVADYIAGEHDHRRIGSTTGPATCSCTTCPDVDAPRISSGRSMPN